MMNNDFYFMKLLLKNFIFNFVILNSINYFFINFFN